MSTQLSASLRGVRMEPRTSAHSNILRVALTGVAAAFALMGAVTPAKGVGQPAHAAAKPTINTYKSWNGKSANPGIICQGTTTAGESITVPDGKTTLDKLAFWTRGLQATGSMVIRWEVYAFDGHLAIGPGLYESPPQAISGTESFHRTTVQTGGVPVTVGLQYVIFASVDKDFEQCVGNYEVEFGSVSGDAYPDGADVYCRSFGHEDWWTTRKWHPDKSHDDNVVKVYLS